MFIAVQPFTQRIGRALVVVATLGLGMPTGARAADSGSSAASAGTIVVTEFALQDDMVPGPGGRAPGGEAVARRTAELASYVRDAMAASDRYRLVPLDTGSDAYRRFENASGRVFECKRCVAELGRALGTEFVAHGWVQRVSNLIINLNVEIIDVDTGRVYDRATVDTRGNTDKSWRDGASYLLRHLQHTL